MTNTAGRFCWYELMTTDTEAAKAFYGDVVGWGTQPADTPDMAYTLFTASACPVAGLMTLPEDARAAGAPPMWVGYVAVEDVDAATERAAALGGGVHVPPADIAGVGRFSVIADPLGAVLVLFRSAMAADNMPAPMQAGHIGWHELLSTDREKAFAFYEAMFGWRKVEALDMGPMGTYQLFGLGELTLGGMFNKPPEVPATFWLYYFGVSDVDAAAARVTRGGGRVLNGPMEVPGGAWIVQAMDPQGVMFALVGGRAAGNA